MSLNDVGYEVFRVKDYIPIESPDSAVISKAQELDTILISLNAEPPRDFATNDGEIEALSLNIA